MDSIAILIKFYAKLWTKHSGSLLFLLVLNIFLIISGIFNFPDIFSASVLVLAALAITQLFNLGEGRPRKYLYSVLRIHQIDIHISKSILLFIVSSISVASFLFSTHQYVDKNTWAPFFLMALGNMALILSYKITSGWTKLAFFTAFNGLILFVSYKIGPVITFVVGAVLLLGLIYNEYKHARNIQF